MSQEFDDQSYREIEAYILQTMPADEVKSFETRMNENDLLKKEVLLQQSVHQSFDEQDWSRHQGSENDGEIRKLHTKLSGEEYQKASQNITTAADRYFDDMSSKNAKKVGFSFYKMGIAASILLMIGLAFFLTRTMSLESQYESLAQWNDVPSIIEKGENTNTAIKGEGLFRVKKYDELIRLYASSDTLLPSELMYLGISYIEVNQSEKALKTFDKLLATQTIDSSRGYWYKLLVYVKEGNKKQAKKMLNVIQSSPDHYNYKKALQLSKEWESLLDIK